MNGQLEMHMPSKFAYSEIHLLCFPHPLSFSKPLLEFLDIVCSEELSHVCLHHAFLPTFSSKDSETMLNKFEQAEVWGTLLLIAYTQKQPLFTVILSISKQFY